MIAAALAVLTISIVTGLLVQHVRQRAYAGRHLARGPVPVTVGAAPVAAPRAPGVGRVAHTIRRRRWLRRSLSVVSLGLVVAAVGMLGYPFYTNLYQSRLQSKLDR